MCLLALTWLSSFFNSLFKTFFFVIGNLSAAIVFSSVSQPPIYLYLHSQDFEIYFLFLRSKLLIFALIKENEFFDLKFYEIQMCALGKIYFLRRYCQIESAAVSFCNSISYKILWSLKRTTVPHHTQYPGHQPILNQRETFTDFNLKVKGVVNSLSEVRFVTAVTAVGSLCICIPRPYVKSP